VIKKYCIGGINMNDWITENLWIFILVLLVAVVAIIVLSVISMRRLKLIVKNTVDSSLRMDAALEFDSITMQDQLVVSVFNTNFRDIIIHSFGFVYKDQLMDFVKEYMKENEMKDYPVVPARASINFKLDPFRVEKFILDNNFDKKAVSKIFNIVVDSVGFDTKTKNGSLRKVFNKRHTARLKKAKVILHNRKVANYQKTHDGKAPFSHIIWKWFHNEEVKIPELMALSKTLRHDEHVEVKEPTKPTKPVKAEDKKVKEDAADVVVENKTAEKNTHKPVIENFDKKKVEKYKKELNKDEKKPDDKKVDDKPASK